MKKFRIRTWWQFGMFPYHAIQDETGRIILKLTEKNYKLAKKLKEVLLKNPQLLQK